MTVSTEVDHNEYTGNGVTTSFPYTFRIFKKSDLVVRVSDLNGNVTKLVLDSGYSVTVTGTYSGGFVVLPSPLAAGWRVNIERVLDVVQETDLRNQGKFFPEVHEDAFDYLTMLIQQSFSGLSLALRKPSRLSNYYDARDNRIQNLASPILPNDGVNRNFVENLFIDKSASASALRSLLESAAGAGIIGTLQGLTVQSVLDNVKIPLTSFVFSIPDDFANADSLAEYLENRCYTGTQVIVHVSAGTHNWNTLNKIFGKEWGFGRLKFVGEGMDLTIIQFLKQDGIYAEAGECYGHAPQFPVSGGDIIPIFSNLTISGIDRDSGIDDPYLDSMGIRAFDGGVVVLDESVRITQFSRCGVMAERHGIAFVPGVKVDTTGSDCFAASEGGYIYCPDSTASNPKGHCYIAYSGGQLYMPNCIAQNAETHNSSNVGGSGLVLTGSSYAYAINLQAKNNAQRGISVALGSFLRADGFTESENILPVTVSQGSTLVSPNCTINKPDALALLIEKGGKAFFQVATTDKFTMYGRATVQSMGVLHAPDGDITNSSGNSISAINSTVDVDRTTFHGSPAVAIYAMDGAIVKCTNGESQTTTGTTIIAQNAKVSADGFKVRGKPSNGFRATKSGRISARNSVVEESGQYSFSAEGLGSFIDATNSTSGSAFTGYKASGGGQINATGTTTTGSYVDAPYNPEINTTDNKLTLISK
ncbi:hypothetical protein DNQ99_10410 [Escherichia coli]|nr:hypothetical protein [Escherichia coli]